MELTGIRKTVFLDRYARKGPDGKPVESSPEEMWDRVARAIAEVEEPGQREVWERRFRQALDGFKFVPGGRILAGAGTGNKVTYYNCYVIPSPEDSRKGIMENVSLMVEIMSRGGGVGVNLSTLRPRGTYVKGVNGTASGPVSWAEVYSTATGSVIQGGSRRGALMLMLDDDHPDIEEFITVKRDLTKITNANLSVCISDAFMEAVQQDLPWDLKWNGKVYKTVRARDLWELICESAWASGEPGVVFMERVNKRSNSWYCERINCVNPCFVGSTRLATAEGLKTMEELYREGRPVTVLTDLRAEDAALQVVGAGAGFPRLGTRLRPAAPVMLTRRQAEVMRLVTEHGFEVVATPDHPFLTPAGYVALKDLRPGDVLFLQSGEGAWPADPQLPDEWHRAVAARGRMRGRIERGEAAPPRTWSRELGQVLGWLTGDGYLYRDQGKPRVGFVFGCDEADVLPVIRERIRRWFGVRGAVSTRNHTTTLLYGSTVATFFESLGVRAVKAREKRVPEALWRAPREAVVGFLQGLFTSDGTVNRTDAKKSCSIRLASSSKALLQDVQLLLLNLGIVAALRERRAGGESRLPDSRRRLRRYATAPQYELILDKANRDRFLAEVGFLSPRKQEKVAAFVAGKARRSDRETYITRVVAVEPAGTADVYDTTEPVTHSLIANGLVAHNCGEQPLGPWGVCNLGAINLAAFVHDGELDLEGLRETVAVAVRFLDNVIDATEYFFPENEKAQRYGIRRIGLGTMGLADMLIKLRIRYGSEKAFEVCEQVYRLIRDEAYRTSALLAKEKGPFPLFDKEKYLQGWFIQRLPEDIRRLIAEHGIRNGFLLTQAPTGTTSLLAGVSSGIEPVFAFSFKRTDRTGTHIVYHELYRQWLEEHPDEPVPDYFVSADQLTPEEHVRMQAVIQQYVDAAISKTVNAPREHTVDQVRTLYRLAYELGCKGITYYRDGSREGVLHKLDDGGRSKQGRGFGEGKGRAAGGEGDGRSAAAATPATVAASSGTASGTAAGPGSGAAAGHAGAMRVTWGKIRPIERPSKLNGFTVRRTTPLGNLYLTLNTFNGYPFELFAQIGKAGSDVAAFTEAIARLVSLAFRAGIDPHEVVEQLRGIGGSRSVGFGPNRVLSVPDAIAQFLDDYLAGKVDRDPVDEVAAGQLTVFPTDPAQQAREAVAAARSAAGEAGDGEAEPATRESTSAGVASGVSTTERAVVRITGGNGRELSMNLCPECGSHALVHEEGCSKCLACGYSEC